MWLMIAGTRGLIEAPGMLCWVSIDIGLRKEEHTGYSRLHSCGLELVVFLLGN